MYVAVSSGSSRAPREIKFNHDRRLEIGGVVVSKKIERPKVTQGEWDEIGLNNTSEEKGPDEWEQAGLQRDDLLFLRHMREADESLMHLNSEHLADRELIICCSCHNQEDLLAWHTAMRGSSIHHPHVMTLACGALGLHEKVVGKLAATERLEELLRVLLEGRSSFQSVSLYVDLPCQHMARLVKGARLNSVQCLEGLAQVKTLLKTVFGQVKVGCFVFVDYGTKRNEKAKRDTKTYVIARKTWRALLEKKGVKRIGFTRRPSLEKLIGKK